MSDRTSDRIDEADTLRPPHPGTNLVAEMQFPPDQIGLARVLRATSGTTVEAEQLVPTRQSRLPYVWVTAENFAPFEEAATVDPTVDRLRLRADTDAGRLYEVEWADSEVELLEWIADNDVTILQADANSDDERWHLKLRFPSQDAASAFHQHCDDRGVRFELVRMFNLVAAKAG